MILNLNNFVDIPGNDSTQIIIRNPEGSIVHKFSPKSITAVTVRDTLIQIHQDSGEQPKRLNLGTFENALAGIKILNTIINQLKEQEIKVIKEADFNQISWYDFRLSALTNKLNPHQWYIITDTDHGNFKLPLGPNEKYKTQVWIKNPSWILLQSLNNGKIYRINIQKSAGHILNGTYIHTQIEKSKSWQINHNMDKFPIISVQSLTGDNLHPGLEYVDNNTIVLSFSEAVDGICYLN